MHLAIITMQIIFTFVKKSSLFITKAFKNCSSILGLRDFKVHLTGFLAREKLAPERKLVSMDLG